MHRLSLALVQAAAVQRKQAGLQASSVKKTAPPDELDQSICWLAWALPWSGDEKEIH